MEGESHVTAIARVIHSAGLFPARDPRRDPKFAHWRHYASDARREIGPTPKPQEQFALQVDLNLECDISADAE